MTLATTLRPPALRCGDTVAIVAPSGVVNPVGLRYGLDLFHSWGLTTRVLPGASRRRGYLAGESDTAKAEELMASFADPQVRAIVAARGGYGAMRLLPLLDWGTIRANPTIFCGFSDITALHQAIRRETGLVTFHGPIASRASAEAQLPEFNADGLHRAFFSTEPLGTVRSPPDGPPVLTLRDGRARGRLVGGNLSLLAALAGTPWALDARGAILLLEDVAEAPYRVDRMLTQLLLSGALVGVAGIVFGDSPTCERIDDGRPSLMLHEVLEDRLGPLGVPLIYGFPCGHSPFRATLPLGLPAELDAGSGSLTLLEAACVASVPSR